MIASVSPNTITLRNPDREDRKPRSPNTSLVAHAILILEFKRADLGHVTKIHPIRPMQVKAYNKRKPFTL